MKNLKRALSLVLSAAMMVGMMVVGTAAADFTDAKGHQHEEAIELMNMIGVMTGDGEKFNPDNVVTRNEMAVVMTNLLDLKLNGDHPFTDVADWADKYVGAIYTNGYTAGKSATTFGGSDKITTAEAALMILKTLGYFEFQGEFGSDWKLATVKKATELGLFEDIDAGINEYLTRGEVAEMVMAALDEYVRIANEKGGMTVEGNGISVSQKAEYTYAYMYNKQGNAMDLAEKLYGTDLTSANYKDDGAVDAFGRPAVKWTYTGGDETETITVTEKPAIVFTASQDDDKITKALKDYTYAATELVFTDGTTGVAVAKADLDTKTGNGVTVEIYADKFDVTRIVVVNEYLGKVTAITAADEDTGAERTVTVDGKTFETEDFARKDMVIYTKADGVIKSMKLAETVEGKVTAKTASYVKLDGVSYKANAASNVNLAATDYNLGNTVSVYVDSNGYIVGLDEVVKAAAALEDYVVVTKKANPDEFGTVQVKVLYADGTTATLTVDPDSAAVSADALYTIEKDDDGYKFTAVASAVKADATAAGYDNVVLAGGKNNKDKATLGGANVSDDAIVFVKNTTNNKFSVISGAELKKLADNTATIVNAFANKSASGFEFVELAYVNATTTTALDDTAYGFVLSAVEDVKNADDKAVKAVTFWNGEETVTVLTNEANNSAAAALVKGSFFSYELNTKGELTGIAAITTGATAIQAFDGKNVKVAAGTYEITEDTVILYVNTKDVKGADAEIIVADETFDANGEANGYVNNVILSVNNDGEIVYMIVDINNEIKFA